MSSRGNMSGRGGDASRLGEYAQKGRVGLYPKGQSGNPGGQTKAQIAIRRLQHELVAEATDGGREIIAFAVAVFRGEHKDCADAKSRRWAADFLADRLWGKAPLTVTVKAAKPVDVRDLKGMSLAQLEQELEQMGAAPREPAALPEPETDDAPAGDVH